MINDKLHKMVFKEYVLPSENLISYKFFRELNRNTKTYSFILKLYVEDKSSGICNERIILLGTSPRK